jgi:hypothetical protein
MRKNSLGKIIYQKILLSFAILMLSGCISSVSAYEKVIFPTEQKIPNTDIKVETTTTPTVLSATATPTIEPSVVQELAQENPVSQPAATQKVDVLTEKFPSPTASLTPIPVIEEFIPDMWKNWPVMPVVSDKMRRLYQQGLAKGNNPNAFSVLGDCQSQPKVFMGVFESQPELVSSLPENLQETVEQFSGSFNRYSPTVKDGTTEGALLWAQWNDNKEKYCKANETPIDCELRVHQPSIVFIHVGTHWEARNKLYLTRLVDKIIQHKAVPVLVFKADNRELDERVNTAYAEIAAERGLPAWNFWATVQHLPDGGMKPTSEMYLSDEAMIIHRDGALQALDTIWRAVRP